MLSYVVEVMEILEKNWSMHHYTKDDDLEMIANWGGKKARKKAMKKMLKRDDKWYSKHGINDD